MMQKVWKWLKKHYVWSTLFLLFALFWVWFFFQSPSHDRDWEVGQDVLPYAEIDGDVIHLHNIRDFEYDDNGIKDVRYVTKTVHLSELQSADFVISHFSDFEGMAHAFVSFGFADGTHISVSVEARREADEKFSAVLGLVRQFEIIYVLGTDRDLIGSRIGYRDEEVYLYPVQSSQEKIRKTFLLFLDEINSIHAEPQFYNTLTNNCTNAITRKVESISDKDFPIFDYRLILPGYADEIAYELEIIPTDAPLEEIRKRHSLESKKGISRDDPAFAQKIRE